MIDFGLLVLIWLVQLVVYPGFRYYHRDQLMAWHKKYTTGITMVVMPLMVGQVILHTIDLYQHPDWVPIAAFFLIVCAWINTFFYAVPLHNKISAGKDVLSAARQLVGVNWFRTVAWSVVFLLNFLKS